MIQAAAVPPDRIIGFDLARGDDVCLMGTVVATVHDSIVIECPSHQFDRLKHHKHHWIEEGTDDDFKWCILNSDLPYAMFAMYGSGSTGAPMWRAFQGVPDREEPVPLMGTYVTNPAHQPPYPMLQQGVFIHADFARVEQRVLEMLMNRPEVLNHEPKAKAPVAAAR